MADGTSPERKLIENTSNLNRGTYWIVASIIAVSLLLITSFIWTYRQLESKPVYEAVKWINSDSICIKPGPIWFVYDFGNDSIKSLKVISDEDKKQLLSLVENDKSCFNSYSAAIDTLAFNTNKNYKVSFFWLLLITGICGATGTHLRTINNFIGVACFKKT